MESDEKNVDETEKIIPCVQCKKTGLFTMDTVFVMLCDGCFVDKKEECKLEWFTKMENDLLPCEVCLELYMEETRLVFYSCKRKGVESCQHCGQQFYSWKSMKKHCKIVHNLVIHGQHVDGQRVESNASKFQFDKQNSIDFPKIFTSVSLQTVKKPYQCTTCNKHYSVKSSLVFHIRSHTGVKPYQCPTCSKSFTDKSGLVKHTHSHTGEKPYHCATCTMSFTIKSNLLRHIRFHVGEKPYQCANL